jgi:hypothetical protein
MRRGAPRRIRRLSPRPQRKRRSGDEPRSRRRRRDRARGRSESAPSKCARRVRGHARPRSERPEESQTQSRALCSREPLGGFLMRRPKPLRASRPKAPASIRGTRASSAPAEKLRPNILRRADDARTGGTREPSATVGRSGRQAVRFGPSGEKPAAQRIGRDPRRSPVSR